MIDLYPQFFVPIERKLGPHLRTDRSFLVPKEEIVEQNYDLSLNRYKEIEYEEVEYDDPKTIINGKDGQPGLRQLAEERLKLLDELEGMI